MTVLPLPFYVLVAFGLIALLTGCAVTPDSHRSPDVYTLQDAKGNRIRLKDERCAGTPAWLDLRTAEMYYQGKDYRACWFMLGGSHIVVLDDNLDKTPIPLSAFKKEEAL